MKKILPNIFLVVEKILAVLGIGGVTWVMGPLLSLWSVYQVVDIQLRW